MRMVMVVHSTQIEHVPEDLAAGQTGATRIPEQANVGARNISLLTRQAAVECLGGF